MLNIAICDDEDEFLDILKNMIDRYMIEKNIAEYHISEFHDGEQLLRDECFEHYDVIFLDINMAGMSGMETAKRIRQAGASVILVFLTAVIDYAVQGYELSITRYILKSNMEVQLKACLSLVIQKLLIESVEEEFSFLDGKRKIHISSIQYVESKAHKCLFHILLGKECSEYILYSKLDSIDERLAKYQFIRIHKSYLVNVKYIRRFSNYEVLLKNGTSLPVPKVKYQEVRERYYEILGEMT